MPSKVPKKQIAARRAPIEKEQPPKWPVLQPLVPPSDLYLDTLLEGQIVLIRNLFTSTLCRNYVSFLSSLALNTTPGQPKKDEALRFNDRYQVDDPVFAEMLWNHTALKGLVTGAVNDTTWADQGPSKVSLEKLWGGQVIGLNPRIRIYRYGRGQFFNPHCRFDTIADCCWAIHWRVDLQFLIS